MLSPDIYYHPRTTSTASTAQYNTAQSTRATSSKASTRRSERDNNPGKSRRSWLAPACRRANVQLAVLSKRTKKSKSARPADGGVMREGFFLSVLSIWSIHAASGLFGGTMELLAFASR